MGMKGSIKKLLRDNVLFLTAVAFLLLADLRSDLYYIRTGSMEPELPVGAVVVTDRYAEPEIGAVFAYQSGGNIIIHRIIGIDGGGYVTKGDANPMPDAVSVTRGQIKGKVVLELTFLAPILRTLLGERSAPALGCARTGAWSDISRPCSLRIPRRVHSGPFLSMVCLGET